MRGETEGRKKNVEQKGGQVKQGSKPQKRACGIVGEEKKDFAPRGTRCLWQDRNGNKARAERGKKRGRQRTKKKNTWGGWKPARFGWRTQVGKKVEKVKRKARQWGRRTQISGKKERIRRRRAGWKEIKSKTKKKQGSTRWRKRK